MNKNKDRLQIIEKKKEYEKAKRFNDNVENEPPTIPLNPEDVDYLKIKKLNKVKTKIANKIAFSYIKKLVKKKKLIIKDVNGFENLLNINTGYILTCNHFNPNDNFALHYVLDKYLKKEKRKFYKVIREGNYSFPGLFGYFFRNCNTLPLSSNFKTMEKFTNAISTILKRKDIILIYPEQSMWWNYPKPRPLKAGAFRFAVKNDVPVVPCFITFNDSNVLDSDGFYVKEYTIHFSKPIYPSKKALTKDEINNMAINNFQVWKSIYEEEYKTPLKYEEEDKL